MFCKKKEEHASVLKIVLIVVGVIAAVAGIAAVLYKLFRKYFTIQFECDDDCDSCEDGCFEEGGAVEPECCDVPTDEKAEDSSDKADE